MFSEFQTLSPESSPYQEVGDALGLVGTRFPQELDCGYVPLFETCVAQLGQGRPYKLSERLGSCPEGVKLVPCKQRSSPKQSSYI